MRKRKKTNYPGVFFREGRRVGRKGTERIYYIVFKKDGRVIEEKAGRQYADDMTPARAARVRAERIEGKRPSPKEIRAAREAQKNKWTIDRLWEEFKRQKPYLKKTGPDESRYNKYLKPAFGIKEPKDLLPLDVDRVRVKMLKTKSPQTVKLTLSLLRRICNFGAQKRLSEPLSFVIEVPHVHNQKTEDLAPEELDRLLEVIEQDTHPQAGPLMKLALFTGMRRGELFKLKWKDIDFDRGFITLVDPKGGPDQHIPLGDAARQMLKSYPRSRSPFVFPGRGGKQRKDIHHQVNQIRDKAGLPKNFRALHGLRHVYASMLASSGEVDMYVLQKLMTHKDPKMTQRYAHLRDKALKKASNVAGDIIATIINSKKDDQDEQKEKVTNSESHTK